MTFDSLTQRIDTWLSQHEMKSTSPYGWLLKLVEEVGELSGVFVKEKSQAEEEGELADVLICVLIYAQCRGLDPLKVAHEKMTINEGRTGRVNRHGVFVKSKDL